MKLGTVFFKFAGCAGSPELYVRYAAVPTLSAD